MAGYLFRHHSSWTHSTLRFSLGLFFSLNFQVALVLNMGMKTGNGIFGGGVLLGCTNSDLISEQIMQLSDTLLI